MLFASNLARSKSLRCFTTVLIVAIVLAACANTPAGGSPTDTLPPSLVSTSIPPLVQPSLQPSTQSPILLASPSVQPTVQPSPQPLITRPLIAPGLSLLAAPVDLPLELRIPSLQVSAAVLGVGITRENVMDAPYGPNDDPIWHKVFWYRGGGIPGDSGTATFAGHVTDGVGRAAVFARITELRQGDRIIVHDTRNGRDVLFLVTDTKSYTYKEAADPSVLRLVYGAGPVAGTGSQPASDGLSHLTLITCSGDFVAGAFDHRFAVYATQTK